MSRLPEDVARNPPPFAGPGPGPVAFYDPSLHQAYADYCAQAGARHSAASFHQFNIQRLEQRRAELKKDRAVRKEVILLKRKATEQAERALKKRRLTLKVEEEELEKVEEKYERVKDGLEGARAMAIALEELDQDQPLVWPPMGLPMPMPMPVPSEHH